MINYHPGQYITVRIKKDGHFHNRHYSLTEPFDGKTYRIAIKDEIEHEPHGVVSTEIIDNYKEGDTLLVSLPAGTFALIDNAEHHLFISGGIGITVMVPLIQQLEKLGQATKATLIQCATTKDQAAFTDKIGSILSADQYHLLCNGEILNQERLKKVLKSNTQVYLCGSLGFMDAVQDLLEEIGHPKNQVHTEAFQPALSVIRGAVRNHSVTKTL